MLCEMVGSCDVVLPELFSFIQNLYQSDIFHIPVVQSVLLDLPMHSCITTDHQYILQYHGHYTV